MTSAPFEFSFRSLICLSAVFCFLFFTPCGECGDSSSATPLHSKVVLINDTPNFQVEVAVDGSEEAVIRRGENEAFDLNGDGCIGNHELVARAYVLSQYSGKRRIGRECRVKFSLTGTTQRSPAGPVGWYHIFTYEDFFPKMALFSKQLSRNSKRNRHWHSRGAAVIRKYQKEWDDDYLCEVIQKAGEKYQIPAALLTAVIEVESGFDVCAISRKGALGLMQLMPQTCTRFGVRRPFHPKDNIEGGAKYLSYLLHQWSLRFPAYRRLELSLAAYNSGERNVEIYGGVPPFKETEAYVRIVLNKFKSLGRTVPM